MTHHSGSSPHIPVIQKSPPFETYKGQCPETRHCLQYYQLAYALFFAHSPVLTLPLYQCHRSILQLDYFAKIGACCLNFNFSDGQVRVSPCLTPLLVSNASERFEPTRTTHFEFLIVIFSSRVSSLGTLSSSRAFYSSSLPTLSIFFLALLQHT